MSSFTFSLVGGDLRIAWLSKLLADDGHIVKLYAHEENDFPFSESIIHCNDLEVALNASEICVLGIPSCRVNQILNTPFSSRTIPFSHVDALLSEHQYLFGGILPVSRENYFDYGKDPAFILANALPTAEGTLQLLMEHLPCVVSGTQMAIIGYGRVAQAVAKLLNAVGVQVTVYARDPLARTSAEIANFAAKELSDLAFDILHYQAVINTVPAIVVPAATLQSASKDTLFVELAAKPGGFDLSAIKEYRLNLLSAPGLPGRVAPQTAALYIKKYLLGKLGELL